VVGPPRSVPEAMNDTIVRAAIGASFTTMLIPY
jgi:hypothetical protein